METPATNLLLKLVRYHLSGSLFSAQGGPLTATLEEGDPDSDVLVIVGDHAAGKSVMVQCLAKELTRGGIRPLQVSMKAPTAADRARVAFHHPTVPAHDPDGNNSLNAISRAFQSARSCKVPTWVFLDEADLGMDENYSAALGAYMANFSNAMPQPHCEATVVVTHNRKLVSALLFSLAKKPHVLCFTQYDAPEQLQAWLEDGRERTLEELLAVSEKSRATYQRIERVRAEVLAHRSAVIAAAG